MARRHDPSDEQHQPQHRPDPKPKIGCKLPNARLSRTGTHPLGLGRVTMLDPDDALADHGALELGDTPSSWYMARPEGADASRPCWCSSKSTQVTPVIYERYRKEELATSIRSSSLRRRLRTDRLRKW